MKDLFQVNNEIQPDDAPEIRVSAEEISATKAEIRRAGSEACIKLVRVTHHPSTRSCLRVIQGTETLLRVRNILGWFYPLLVLFVPLAIVFITPWSYALVLIAMLFLLLNSLQSEINLELGARFLVIHRRSKNAAHSTMMKRPEPPDVRPD